MLIGSGDLGSDILIGFGDLVSGMLIGLGDLGSGMLIGLGDLGSGMLIGSGDLGFDIQIGLGDLGSGILKGSGDLGTLMTWELSSIDSNSGTVSKLKMLKFMKRLLTLTLPPTSAQPILPLRSTNPDKY